MTREVHKFGGASVRDADAVRNVGRILADVARPDVDLAVVVSAMGKTTNAMESVWSALPEGEAAIPAVERVRRFHAGILDGLSMPWSVLEKDWALFEDTMKAWKGQPADDRGYDALVGFGERFSTRIVHAHLAVLGLQVEWVSAWELIVTDAAHRAARVDLEETRKRVVQRMSMGTGALYLTQGFVGGSLDGTPTTLGREGSDFSGALIAEALGAERLVVWKDVSGVMTGDPRRWPPARRIERLDYGTAERMSAAGAGILHPATMAPLRRADIPLQVRSFLDPEAPGTLVTGAVDSLSPGPTPCLWAFTRDGQGCEVVRCLTGDAGEAEREWRAAFPDRVPEGLVPDPDITGCWRLAFGPA